MEEEKKICPVCGTEVPSSYNHDLYLTFYRCPVCGQYQLDVYWKEQGFNMNHLAAFLATMLTLQVILNSDIIRQQAEKSVTNYRKRERATLYI